MELSKKSISRYLDKNGVTWKRLKYTAAQRNPLLRVDYLQRVEEFYDDQLVFLDESAANEFTKDRKSGWSLKGAPAIKERDFRRSERWSILPAYWQPPPYGLPPASPWTYFSTPASPLPPLPPERTSSPPGAESEDDMRAFLIWFKEREPLRLGDIERIEAVLIQEHIGLHSLRTLPEARIARFELPSGIIDRMKATISKWRAGG